MFTSTFSEDIHSLSDCFPNCGGRIPRILRMMLLLAITGKIISKILRLDTNYYPKTFSTFSAAPLNNFLWHIPPVSYQGSKYTV